MEPGSFPEVHLFLTTTEEHVQGVQASCDPCVKREGSSRRYRKPFNGEIVCRCISGGATWDVIGEGIGFYHRPKTREWIDSENTLLDFNPRVIGV